MHKKQVRLSPDRRRAQLLEAAVSCLLEDGLESLTLERVSKRCGTSISLISRYFGGRAGLLAAIYQNVSPELAALDGQSLNTEERALTALMDFIAGHFEPSYYSPENLSVWTAVFSAVRSDLELRSEYTRGEEKIAAHMIGILDRLGSIRNKTIDSVRISKSFLALLDGLWLQCSIAPTYMSPSDARRYALAYLDSQIDLSHHTSRLISE
jgi:AcrR family transcriptional regulator